jgi:hypothetical protein
MAVSRFFRPLLYRLSYLGGTFIPLEIRGAGAAQDSAMVDRGTHPHLRHAEREGLFQYRGRAGSDPDSGVTVQARGVAP